LFLYAFRPREVRVHVRDNGNGIEELQRRLLTVDQMNRIEKNAGKSGQEAAKRGSL
jgi:hypothetical protein